MIFSFGTPFNRTTGVLAVAALLTGGALAGGEPAAAGVDPESATCFASGAPFGSGVVANGTAALPTAPGYLNFYSSGGAADPTANSSVNYTPPEPIANSVVVPVLDDGQTCVYNSTEVDVIADVSGYIVPEAFLGFSGGEAIRVFDSRNSRKFEPGETFCFSPAANAEVGQPVVANMTIAAPEASGFANLYPKGATPDATSVINFVLGRNIANGVTVTVGADTEVCVYTSARAHIIVDIIGAVEADRYRSAKSDNSAERILDTRDATPLGTNETRCIDTSAAEGEAVVLNATAVRSSGRGFLNVFSEGAAADPASNSSVNFAAGANIANGIIVLAGTGGRLCLFVNRETDVLLDVSGYLAEGTFLPFNSDGSATRVLDTRTS